MSKDIPIIFSAPMVRALLEGRKTMTRRVLKRIRVAATLESPAFTLTGDSAARALLDADGFRNIDGDLWAWTAKAFDYQAFASRTHWHARIPYAVGDRLWVRESFCGPIYELDDNDQPTGEREYFFRADGYPYGSYLDQETDERRDASPWKPSIHMPRWLSRLTLIVTGVKIERLADISTADAIAEGATSKPGCSGFESRYEGWSMDWSEVGHFSKYATGGPGPLQERDISLGTARTAFLGFINLLHGGPNWNCHAKKVPLADQNPFVVAITFRVIKANIDSAEARIAA